MTSTEAFEAKLSQSSDSTPLRGKVIFTQSTGTTATPVNALALVPSVAGFGARANAFADVFSRYRFKYVKFRFLTSQNTTGTATIASIGVQDDIAVTANNPATVSGVAELRCSGTVFANQTVPTQFEWQPADKNLWYYTTNDLTESRLSTSGILWAASSTVNGVVEIEMDFCIVFKGATDSGSV